MSEGPGGFVFGSPPPEFIAQLLQQREHRNMHMQDNTHAIKQLLDSLGEEQLRSLDLLLANCGEREALMFFRGRIEMLQQIKFNICPCGEPHDPDQEFAVAPEPEPEPIPEAVSHADLAKFDMIFTESGNLACKNCGKVYPNLQDRMRRPPGIDGCNGCQEKSAWG